MYHSLFDNEIISEFFSISGFDEMKNKNNLRLFLHKSICRHKGLFLRFDYACDNYYEV